MRKLLVFLTHTKLYNWFLLKFLPGKRLTYKIPSLNGHKYHAGYDILQPGDIVLTIDTNALTGKIIRFLSKGEFSHAALCVGKYPKPEIAEMLANGFNLNYFYDLVHEANQVVIIRCVDFDPSYIKKIIKKCLSFKDAPYDTAFQLGVKALYCSELVYQSDYERRLKVDLEDLSNLGTKYISPTGLFLAKNCVIVWDSSWQTNQEKPKSVTPQLKLKSQKTA